MSDNRKLLVPKRKNNERTKSTCTDFRTRQAGNNNFKKGVKRLAPQAPTKNLANDRLKKLRSSLIEEVQNSSKQFKSLVTTVKVPKVQQKVFPRKRQLNEGPSQDASVSKVSKNSMYKSETSVLLRTTTTDFQSGSDSKSVNKVVVNQNVFTPILQNSCPVVTSPRPTESDLEAMEWSTTDDDTRATMVNACGSTSSRIITYNDNEVLPNASNKKNNLFIVVDTNIFISHMVLIRNIIEMRVTDEKIPIIFIPWMVIEELDWIKEDSNKDSLKWKAQEAIKYIEKALTEKNERIIGQTLNEVNEQKSTGKSQDDKIIACCLQVLEKHPNMILLTNDINLRNKAHINHIPVCSQKEIMTKISLALNDQTKVEMILEKMTSLCTVVIHQCAAKAYGQACNKMQICQNTPQSLQDCIKIFLKYWFPVFEEVLMKQFRKSVDDLSAFLTNNKTIKDDSNEMNDLLRLCVRVCIFLKDVDSCKDRIESTIREINDIKGP